MLRPNCLLLTTFDMKILPNTSDPQGQSQRKERNYQDSLNSTVRLPIVDLKRRSLPSLAANVRLLMKPCMEKCCRTMLKEEPKGTAASLLGSFNGLYRVKR